MKRAGTSSSRGPPARKRQRQIPEIGAPSEYDLLTPQSNPSSSAWSSRPATLRAVPSLVTLSINAFAANLVTLHQKDPESIRYLLKLVPETLLMRLWSALRREQPTVLSHGFIVANFIRGGEIVLTGELPGVDTHTLRAVSELGQGLLKLELSGLAKVSDNVFALVIKDAVNLGSLVLRGSTKAGVKTAAAISKCKTLKTLNLNYTSVPSTSLVPIFLECLNLEVVKLAAIPKLNPHSIASIMQDVLEGAKRRPTATVQPLQNVKSLKLRLTGVNDASLLTLISHTPNLTTLDVSFTAVHGFASLNSLADWPHLQKISVTACPLRSFMWLTEPTIISNLRTLNLGAIAENGSVTLTDDLLEHISALPSPASLENLSLVGNSKLGAREAPLHDFISKIGRTCKRLNLGGIPNLSTRHLHGLVSEDGSVPNIIALNLSNTSIDDDAADFISACRHLETLELANTKITRDGAFAILNACPELVNLDLTSCRGIRVTDRRRFFEVWEEEFQRVDQQEEDPEDDKPSTGRRRMRFDR
ncbi:hypothetical protein FRB97_004696 [Tulasnella sp. 331]|nr:hypothetical protein FRB97_004696 [Tulasnella sp. 331]KAG8881164.1 hypothetical protein FRB98_004515 [Tulasnella sp. 332]